MPEPTKPEEFARRRGAGSNPPEGNPYGPAHNWARNFCTSTGRGFEMPQTNLESREAAQAEYDRLTKNYGIIITNGLVARLVSCGNTPVGHDWAR